MWLFAATLIVFTADRLLHVQHGLTAAYFDGPSWRDSLPPLTVVDALPSTGVLKQRRPDFADQPFSVEWRGFIVVLRGGTYTFATISDDGSWLSVDGKLIVENPGRHSPVTAQGRVELEAGVHPVLIRYFQDGGDVALETRWGWDGAAHEPIPASAWLIEPASYGRLAGERAARVALLALAIVWLAAVVLKCRHVPLWTTRRLVSVWNAFPPAFRSVLLLSLLQNIWGIWWALPNTRGWAPDEVVPVDVLGASRVLFSHGWHTKYPPFHYALLSMADSPVLLLSWLGLVDLGSPGPYTILFVIGRLVSLALAAGTIAVVYLVGRELYGDTGAVFAALTAALMAPFVYYGKLTNLDVPYLFWFAVSLLAYVRILARHARRDYLLFGASAALAVCTKDQAYGLYVLTPFAILVARWRRSKRAGGSLVDVFADRTMIQTVLLAAVVFLLADNVVFNYRGFVGHVHEVLGPASASYQMFSGTAGGQLSMAWLAVQELRHMFGWPLAVVVAVAVASGIVDRSTNPLLRWLLVPAVSYYAAFIGVVLYFFDRFLLPIGLVLALFAGYWIERFIAPQVSWRRVRVVMVSAAFAYSVIYVAEVNYALTNDSRYAVTEWLQTRAGRTQIVAARGPLEYFVIGGGFMSASVESVEDLAAVQPAFIVLDADQMTRLPPGHSMRTLHDALLDGRAGYRLSLNYRAPSLPWPGQHPDLRDRRRSAGLSSFALINPRLEVFERMGSPGG